MAVDVLLVGSVLFAVGCAATSQGPLPTDQNQNRATAGSSISRAAPSFSDHVALWCSQPSGQACHGAERLLSARAVDAEEIPEPYLAPSRDLEDDCFDPDLMPWMERVTSAIGASTRGWADQEGRLTERDTIRDLFAGAGCTNAAAPDVPVTKIHLVDRPDGLYVLVRVWERGEEH